MTKPILLKNGSTTLDSRLTRIQQFDERSRSYPVTATIDPAKKPRSYTWSCGTHLDQGAEGACFPPGTLVRMADGSHKKIEDVKNLDSVVTAESNTGKVLQCIVRQFEGNLVEFKVRGHHKVRCTPEHPILTRRGYVPAKDLTKEDFVCVTRYNSYSETTIAAKSLVKHVKIRGASAGTVNTGGVPSEIAEMPETISLSVGFGRLIGLYAAEGCTTPNKVTWCFGSHEEHTLVAETILLLKDILGIQARIQVRPNNGLHVVAYGKTWKQLFEVLVPGTSKHGDKRLSNLVMSGSPEYLKAILYGWLDGDGHRRRTSHEGISVCPNLALDMHAIANGLGLIPTINTSPPTMNRYAKTRQYRWTVTLPGGSGRMSDRDEKAVWRKVGSTELIPYSGYVHNLHVEGDESYVANGIGVHNCTGFAFAHELIAKPAVHKDIDASDALQIYHRAQQFDPWPGGSYPNADPFYEGTSVLAAAQVMKQRGYIKEYRWAFSLDDLILAVGHRGPAVLGIDWYSDMYDTDRDGYVSATGQFTGGHAILAKGVNLKGEYFTLHNSWGPDWGVKGDAKISFADMDFLLQSQGEACIPVTRASVSLFQDIVDSVKSAFYF